MKPKTHLLVTALAVAGFSQIASAVPVFPSVPGLYLYDEATGTGQAVAAVSGFASFFGTVGDYTVSVTGVTITGGSSPFMDLDVAFATAGKGATKLDVFYSDGLFGPTGGTYMLDTTGPGTGGPVVTSAYLDTTVFGQTTALGGSTDGFPFTVNATGSLNAGSYYLTLEDSITGSETSVDSSISVPDGGATVMLLGIALSGVGLLRKKLSA
jgi:hypothetical protein